MEAEVGTFYDELETRSADQRAADLATALPRQIANAQIRLTLQRTTCGFSQRTRFWRRAAMRSDHSGRAEHLRGPQDCAYIMRVCDTIQKHRARNGRSTANANLL